MDRSRDPVAGTSDVSGMTPGSAVEHLRRGMLLARSRQWAEAIEHFEQGRAADPVQADLQLGRALIELRHYERAAPWVASALEARPDSPTANYLDGLLREQRGDMPGARDSYSRAVSLENGLPMAHARLAAVLHAQGELDRARRHYTAAVELEPALAPAWANLGRVYEDLGDIQGAVEQYRQGLAHCAAADAGDLHFRLGSALAALGWDELAGRAFRDALASGHDDAATWFNLGNSARALGDLDEARLAFERALEREPGHVAAMGNLGVVWEGLGEPEQALRCYHQALVLEPDNAVLHWNRGLVYLATGRMRPGWEDYTWGYKAGKRSERDLPYPAWNGSSLAGRCILVHAEGDLAAQVFFGTCLPDLVKQAGSCIVECDERLEELLAASLKGATVVGKSGLAQMLDGRQIDCRASVAALPGILRPSESGFPRRPGYLRPEPARRADWRQRLERFGPGLKVGIALGGGSAGSTSTRLPPLTEFDLAPLFNLAGLTLINLDGGRRPVQAGSRTNPWDAYLADWLPGNALDSLHDYAALLRVLDLVICVDNATAHLAGAVGARAIVLLPAIVDWRWMCERADTPWYPTVRLVRQARNGDWNEAMEQVREAVVRAVTAAAHGDELPAPETATDPSPPSLQASPELSALFERAVNSQRLGLLEEAGTAYRELVRSIPDNADIWNNLGGVLQQLGYPDEAEDSLRKAVQFGPESPEILFNLAAHLRQRDRNDEAAELLVQVLQLDPGFLKAHGMLCRIYHAAQQFDRALSHYRAALELEPGNLGVRVEYARLLHQTGPLDQAEREYERCLADDPLMERALLGLSAVLADTDRFDAARSYVDTVLAMQPDSAAAHSFMGRLHQVAGDLDQAETWYDAAGKLDPVDTTVKCNLGMVLLQRGEFQRGWALNESRPSLGGWTRRSLSWPVWEGGDLAGRGLLVYPEQGIGDEIMFASCYPELIARAGKCAIGCSDRLAPLFQRAFPAAVIIPQGVRVNLPQLVGREIDFEIAAGSVLQYLRPTFESFGAGQPFLEPEPQLAAEMRARLAALGAGPKIGISWHGGGTGKARWQRSIALAKWESILRVPGVHWVSVQYGAQDQLPAVEAACGVSIRTFDDVNPLQDMERFAALLSGLDLVISVDNSTVHLAGALGVEAWTLLPHVAEWRWFLGRSDSPWYRSLRLFRQARHGKWAPVLEEVRAALEHRMATNPVAARAGQ